MGTLRAVDLRPEPAAAPRPPLLHRVTQGRLLLIDRLIAGLLLLVVALHVLRIAEGIPPPNSEIELVVVWSLAALSIAVRRQSAVGGLVLMTAAVILDVTWGPGGGPSNLPDVLIALPMFQLAATTDRRPSLAALGAELVVLTTAASAGGPGGRSLALGAGLVATASWFIGDSVRVRRVYVAGLAEQAAQRQREALERAQRSLAEERLQIARELHDVVAHSLSVIAIQSGVGRHVIDVNPTEAKRALGAVEETSRAALDELRRMLGVLRGHDQEPAERAPAPGIASLGRLVDQVRAAGIPVELDVTSGLARALSPAAELSVYRIVQEALTNIVKHAGPASAYVGLRDDGSELVLEVRDDGLGAGGLTPYPGSVPQGSGQHGLVGMRERVALFGGLFAAGPRPEGGYRVIARFPVAAVSAA
jgi:signal transduction histidine kinase